MEIILAVVVASAVIFFGALISIGNERQRKAIDHLRDHAALWATQDLKIKREILAHNVNVPDPLVWINEITSKAHHRNLNLKITEAVSEPQSLVCISKDNLTKVVITPFSPTEIKMMKRRYRGRLSQYSNQNPLLSLPHDTTSHAITMLNSSILFDLELQIAWRAITGMELESSDQIWLYISSMP